MKPITAFTPALESPFKYRPKGRRWPSLCRGFSMVEFLVAAFIFSIGILGLTALQVGAMKQSGNSRGRVTATYVAECVMQEIQAEGQQSYNAKLQGITNPLTKVFLTDPAANAIANHNYAGFNVDGMRVSNITSTNTSYDTNDIAAGSDDIANLAARVPDPAKRRAIYTVSWARQGYPENSAPTSDCHAQAFIVNVRWRENGIEKFLSMSRNIRY